jgi:hypothetical protein
VSIDYYIQNDERGLKRISASKSSQEQVTVPITLWLPDALADTLALTLAVASPRAMPLARIKAEAPEKTDFFMKSRRGRGPEVGSFFSFIAITPSYSR